MVGGLSLVTPSSDVGKATTGDKGLCSFAIPPCFFVGYPNHLSRSGTWPPSAPFVDLVVFGLFFGTHRHVWGSGCLLWLYNLCLDDQGRLAGALWIRLDAGADETRQVAGTRRRMLKMHLQEQQNLLRSPPSSRSELLFAGGRAASSIGEGPGTWTMVGNWFHATAANASSHSPSTDLLLCRAICLRLVRLFIGALSLPVWACVPSSCSSPLSLPVCLPLVTANGPS